MSRKLVIGDIHGGLRALTQVLDRAKVDESDSLIFLGDYVDGWSESAETIDFLIKLSKSHNCIFIRGNHDLWCGRWLDIGTKNPVWLAHGGEGTIESYIRSGMLIDSRHRKFFENLVNYHIDDNNSLFIHAGFTSMHGVEKEHNLNDYYWDRTLWETARVLSALEAKKQQNLYTRLNLYREIYIGHTPTTNYGTDKPIFAANLINVDTGAGFKGPITVLDVESKMYWQSDPVHKLYPDELGRN